MSRLAKAIQAVRAARANRQAGEEILSKGVHDAMFHHVLHKKAADAACMGKPGGKYSEDHYKKCKDHSKKHEFLFLRHALENARSKAAYSGDMKHKLQKAMDYFEGEGYGVAQEDPEYKKACDHYIGGGEFKGHKDDKFKEDY